MTKNILSIFLLACNVSYGQIVITAFSGQTTTSDGSAFGYTGTTFTQGHLYLFVAGTTGTPNAGSITSSTLTWTSVVSVGDATRRLQVFRCMPSSTVTGEDVSIGSFGGASTGFTKYIYDITGVVTTGTNGSDAIVQAVTNTGAASADPSITMAAISNGRNAVATFWFNSLNPFGGTPESGWTEGRDLGYATPDAGDYYMYRYNTTDNTPTVTAASSDWAGIAIELQSAARRRINITKNDKNGDRKIYTARR